VRLPPSPLFPLLLIATVVAGCGSKVGATHGPTHTPRPTAGVQLATAGPATSTAPSPTPKPKTKARGTSTPTAQPTPGLTPTVVAAAPGVVAASVTPARVVPGAPITLSVTTSGAISRVEMYIGSGLPGASPPTTLELQRQGSGQWGTQGSAPHVPGVYQYTVGFFAGGKRTMIDNNAWNITVTGSVPQRPDDLPLAPGFDYGNPIGAIFQAMGHTVDGAEIISTTQPNVSPSYVANWYTTRLPRAGWTISGAPAAGATSFTITADTGSTPGSQVCIVQYAGYTLHLYYGTL